MRGAALVRRGPPAPGGHPGADHPHPVGKADREPPAPVGVADHLH